MTESTELVATEALVPAVVFAPGGVRTILDKLKADVRAIKTDISTPKGRAAVKSLAFRVARSKTALDELGKDLVADLKKQTGAIDAERRTIRDELDDLKVEVLRDLTAWEEAEERRIAGHNEAIEAIFAFAVPTTFPNPPIYYRNQMAELDAFLASPRDWQEFVHKAKEAADLARQTITDNLVAAEAREAAEAEAARLAAEQEAARVAEQARLQAEREAEIARQAAERAEREAEREAASLAEAAALAARREQARLEQERQDAVRRAEEAENRRRLEAEMAETARLAAERQKEREIAEAAAAERKLIEDQQRRIREEEERRARDKAHRARVNGEVKADLLALGLSEAQAVAVITAAVKGGLRHIKIDY